MGDLKQERLLHLARIGARKEIEQHEAEIGVLRSFLAATDPNKEKPFAGLAPRLEEIRRVTKRPHPMKSVEARTAASERMKKYWRKRKKMAK